MMGTEQRPPSGSGKKGKSRRKLTPFLCQEMLYDFALDRLDADRRVAVEEFLASDTECRKLLDGIHEAIKYAEQLAGAQIKPDIGAQLRDAESAASLGRRYSSWKEWPEAIRWSITAIVLSAVAAAFVAVVPWDRLPSLRTKKSDTIEIAEIPRPTDKQLEDIQERQEGDTSTDEGSGDDEIEAPEPGDGHARVATAAQKAQPPTDGESSGDDGEDADSAAPPARAAAKPAAPATGKPTAASAAASAAATVAAGDAEASESTSSEEHRKEPRAKGFVFRAFMNLSNLDELGVKIADQIVELGGEKAGEVELGWKRGTGRYYHFAMPEENQEKLLEKLRAYGPVRISKDPHPRVMPEGKVRIILWIESAN